MSGGARNLPTAWNGEGERSRSRVWLRRGLRVPAGTVTMTTYFHTDTDELRAIGDDYLLGQAEAQAFYKGFFDQTAQLWSRQGHLLATSQQVMYFKD